MSKTTFNHGYLCQMLRSANDEELANIINDIAKEQQRRDIQQKMLYTEKITNAINEAVKAGYTINFYSTDNSNAKQFPYINDNSLPYLFIELSK